MWSEMTSPKRSALLPSEPVEIPPQAERTASAKAGSRRHLYVHTSLTELTVVKKAGAGSQGRFGFYSLLIEWFKAGKQLGLNALF